MEIVKQKFAFWEMSWEHKLEVQKTLEYHNINGELLVTWITQVSKTITCSLLSYKRGNSFQSVVFWLI